MSIKKCLCIAIAALVLTIFAPKTASQFAGVSILERNKILILVGPQYGLPMVESILPALMDTFLANGVSLEDIFVEFLDLHRSGNPGYRSTLLTLLKNKLKIRT